MLLIKPEKSQGFDQTLRGCQQRLGAQAGAPQGTGTFAFSLTRDEREARQARKWGHHREHTSPPPAQDGMKYLLFIELHLLGYGMG